MLSALTLEDEMERYAAQHVLFAARPTRMSLLTADRAHRTARRVRINVWRNHAFEPIEPLVEPYAVFGGWAPEFRLGPYDDALLFPGASEGDIELVWYDRGRFVGAGGFAQWLCGRLAALRAVSAAPIVVVTWSASREEQVELLSCTATVPSGYMVDLAEVASSEGVQLLTSRSSAVAGTPLSAAAQVIVARKLACHWLPAASLPPIKAVALDLDNTLHAGVLGEDGIDGVRLTAAHRRLQQYAVQLRQRGVFLALVSRNEYTDVKALFDARTDYPLRWADFSAVEVSWGEKAVALAKLAQALRIATDAVLFVDDNAGELANVRQRLPDVHTLHAGDDPDDTLRALEHYPGLWRWKVEADDTKRVEDLKASATRQSMQLAASDPSEYLRSLGVTLDYRYDPIDQLSRLADLCKKTNQFNLALRRMTAAELAAYMASDRACIGSVRLRDRLSDSGVIAVVAAHRVDADLVVEEVCISCRALGRNLENTVVIEALRRMPIFHGCEQVVFRFRHGPRNEPALTWLTSLTEGTAMTAGDTRSVPSRLLRAMVAPSSVQLIYE